jgi:16S rRNA (uracil1498-N3)-methyltransferase
MASLPRFYYKGALIQGNEISLDEDTVRHVIQVLRMQPGGSLELTNGEGYVASCIIARVEKKKCSVVAEQVHFYKEPSPALHLAVAFTKNSSRNEWLLEKATELGVRSIIPLMATRTEREKIRYDRWQNILVSALLQSQQHYLPHLPEAVSLEKVLQQYAAIPQKYIGHCIEGHKRISLAEMLKPALDTLILIGPEGDFTPEEVNLCTAQGFTGMSIGAQRLRTETAAISVCAYFNILNRS